MSEYDDFWDFLNCVGLFIVLLPIIVLGTLIEWVRGDKDLRRD